LKRGENVVKNEIVTPEEIGMSSQRSAVGEFSGGGAAKTSYWVDPQEEIVGLLMSQSMMQMKQEKNQQVMFE
jgi:CubicO group peptidase (beta-lactamase class C family)